MRLRPVLGLDVAIPLVLMQASLHPVTVPLVAFDLSLTHAIYGRDRLVDQLAAEECDPSDPIVAIAAGTTSASWLLAAGYLAAHHHGEAVPWLAVLSNCYASLKPAMSLAKPLIVGASWAYAIVVLPGEGAVDLSALAYYCAIFCAASSVMDVKDADADRKEGVMTLPVQIGARATYAASACFAGCAAVLHGCSSPVDALIVGFAFWCSLRAALVENTI